jgi:hypothetical protein
MARKLRTKKQPKIVRMQPPGLYGSLEAKPDKAVLAQQLAETDESGLKRFLSPSTSGLNARLDQIEIPDTVGFLSDDEPKDESNNPEENQ